MAAHDPRTVRTQFGDRIVNHFARNVGALEQTGPGRSPLGRAGYYHPVDRLEHGPDAVERSEEHTPELQSR